MTKIPSRKLFLTFNIGAVYWSKLGDGVSAKAEFEAAAGIQQFESDKSWFRVMRANALENLMLCAASYEEFDEFTARVRQLAPEMPVVSGLPPEIDAIRNSGAPWSTAMISLADTNYNRNNPALDRGRYGVAKSTYHILLSTRKRQRLSRADWRMAVFELCALGMRMTSDCVDLRGGDADGNSPEEFLPILTIAVPFIEEYLSTNAEDEGIRKVRENMQSMIDNARQRWAARSDDVEIESSLDVSGSEAGYRCGHCHKPVVDPTEACPACGSPSSFALMIVPYAILVVAIAAGFIAWHFSAAFAEWERGLISVGAATFIFAVVGPILFQICRAALKEKNV
jgi:hypothetical protein